MSSIDTAVSPANAPAAVRSNQRNYSHLFGGISIHAALLTYTVIAMFPIVLTIINSFKKQGDIFGSPYGLPIGTTISVFGITYTVPIQASVNLFGHDYVFHFGTLLNTIGYQTVFKRAEALLYLRNSLVVTVGAVGFTLLFGSMAAFALTEYKFRGNTMLGLYMALGIMIPIRLGTVSIVKLSTSLGLTGTLQGLIFIYLAQNLPLAIFILSQFFREIPIDLKDAARIDGATEYRVFFMVVPLIRQAMFSVIVFTMIPIWNDLWFPLIMASSDSTRTITLGVQSFIGEFGTNWSALLAALTLAMLPVLIIYTIFSRQLIKGLMTGAVKQ